MRIQCHWFFDLYHATVSVQLIFYSPISLQLYNILNHYTIFQFNRVSLHLNYSHLHTHTMLSFQTLRQKAPAAFSYWVNTSLPPFNLPFNQLNL